MSGLDGPLWANIATIRSTKSWRKSKTILPTTIWIKAATNRFRRKRINKLLRINSWWIWTWTILCKIQVDPLKEAMDLLKGQEEHLKEMGQELLPRTFSLPSKGRRVVVKKTAILSLLLNRENHSNNKSMKTLMILEMTQMMRTRNSTSKKSSTLRKSAWTCFKSRTGSS